jgi:hypothetical protein
MSDKVED